MRPRAAVQNVTVGRIAIADAVAATPVRENARTGTARTVIADAVATIRGERMGIARIPDAIMNAPVRTAAVASMTALVLTEDVSMMGTVRMVAASTMATARIQERITSL